MAVPRVIRGLLGRGLWSLALLSVILSVLLTVIFGTPGGTRYALQKALALVPQATVGQIRGTLWQGITLEGIRYEDASGTKAEVQRACLALSWPGLLAMRLHVRHAEVSGIRLLLPESPPSADPGPPPDIEDWMANLPLEIQVDAFHVQDVTLRVGPEADVIRLDSLDSALHVDRFQAVIPQLTLALAAPVAMNLEAKASLELTAPHRLTLGLDGELVLDEGRLDLSLASEGALNKLMTTGGIGWRGENIPDAAVHLAVAHSLTEARIQDLSADILDGTLTLRGTVNWKQGVEWDLHLTGRDLMPASAVEVLDGPVSFDLDSQGSLDEQGKLRHDSHLTRGHITVADLPLTDLRVHAGGDLTRVEVHELAVDLLDGHLAAEGRVGWQDGIHWQASTTGHNLNPGHFAEAASGRVGFQAVTEGRLDGQGRLTHETRLDDLAGVVAAIPFEALGLTVAGDLKNIRIRDLTGRILDARLAGEGSLQPGQEGIGWDGRLALDNADLAKLKGFDIDPVISGRLGLDLTSRGQWRNGQAGFTADLERLRGELAGQKISGRIQVRVAGETVRLQPADLTLGANHVHLSGTVTPPLDLQYRLSLPDLAALPIPPELELAVAGRLEGEGHLRGTLEAPDVDARLSGRSLAFEDLRLAEIDLNAKADHHRLTMEATLNRLAAADWQVDTAIAKINGSLPEHELTLAARTDHGRLELTLDGGLRQRLWLGRLTGLNLQETQVGSWTLDQPVALRLSEQDFLLGETCLVQMQTESSRRGQRPKRVQARVCASASRQAGQPIQAALNAVLPLALVRRVLPPTLGLPGEVAIQAEARIGETITAEAALVLPDNRIIARGLTDEPLSIDYRDTRVTFSLSDQQMDARVKARLPDYLELNGEIQARLDGDQPLSGRILLQMSDMAWLSTLIPAVSDLTGRAEARIALAGTLTQPQPGGRITIEDLAATVPATGVAYRQGRLQVDIGTDPQIELEGGLVGATGGRLHITGHGSVAELPEWRLGLVIDGEDLPLMRTNAWVVDASPALVVSADGKAAEVRGRVVLPRVESRVERLPEGSVDESPDLVIVGQEEETVAGGYRLRTDVEIVLGEGVSLEGMGFSAGLAGQIRLRGDETAPVAAFGEVDIRKGRYTAFGQDLTIARGRLTFNGPLDDPGLDVRASRTVGDYQTGLDIGGTLSTPRSQVFSVPALPESDALSLLFTGRRLSEGASGTEADLLINALAGLGIKKGDDIARDIGQAAGFDELGLDTDNGLEGTRLTVGKRINSRLLVRYAVGLFDGVGKFITQYKINRHLDLEVSSSPEAQGGDLIYRIER